MLSLDEKIMLMRAAMDEGAPRHEQRRSAHRVCACARHRSTLRIVARGHNKVNALQRKVAHAEMVTFENASICDAHGIPALPLDAEDAIMVSTLEPCVMCLGAAMEAGVKIVVFGLAAPADNGTQRGSPSREP